jgi:hypothetical protein
MDLAVSHSSSSGSYQRNAVAGLDCCGPLFRSLLCDHKGRIQAVGPAGSIDSFSRLRVGLPFTLFESKQTTDDQPLLWENTTPAGTSATHSLQRASTTLQVDANTAATASRTSRQYLQYAPGKSQLILMTGVVQQTGTTGLTRRLGYFDDNNGVFYEHVGETMSVVIRSNTSGSPVDTSVAQSSWNIDRLDGTGPSGITVDWTKAQIFGIQFQWLGVGSAQFFLDINEEVLPIHRVDHANVADSVYMSTPNLPLRYELQGDGANDAGTLEVICCSVQQEASPNGSQGIQRGVDRGRAELTVPNNTSGRVLVAIRLKSGYEGVRIIVRNVSILATSAATFIWHLVLNPTISSGSYTFTPVTNAAVDVHNTTNDPAITDFTGTVLASGCHTQANGGRGSIDFEFNNNELLHLGTNASGTNDILAFVVYNAGGGSTDYLGSLNWLEQY